MMSIFNTNFECIEPFIEHQGEMRSFWLRKPRLIGDRILLARKDSSITGSFSDKIVIFLDIKSAFGTGGHGTTEGCILALEKHLKGREEVLDVGTGTGILAIAAFKLGAKNITAVEIDKNACIEAKKNLALNSIKSGIEIIHGNIKSAEKKFDIIAANLRTLILVELMEDICDRMKGGGILILSGILERELPFFQFFLEKYPLQTIEIKRIHGWMTVVINKDCSKLKAHS